MPIHTVAVGGFVTNENNEVLLVKSPRRGWEFPGGIVEAGESLTHALMREIQEESGVTVTIAGIVGIYTNVIRNIVNVDFYCMYRSGVLTISEESVEVGWFTKKQAREMITHPLYISRFKNMLENSEKFYCWAFKSDSFSFVEKCEFDFSK